MSTTEGQLPTVNSELQVRSETKEFSLEIAPELSVLQESFKENHFLKAEAAGVRAQVAYFDTPLWPVVAKEFPLAALAHAAFALNRKLIRHIYDPNSEVGPIAASLPNVLGTNIIGIFDFYRNADNKFPRIAHEWAHLFDTRNGRSFWLLAEQFPAVVTPMAEALSSGRNRIDRRDIFLYAFRRALAKYVSAYVDRSSLSEEHNILDFLAHPNPSNLDCLLFVGSTLHCAELLSKGMQLKDLPQEIERTHSKIDFSNLARGDNHKSLEYEKFEDSGKSFYIPIIDGEG